MSRAIGRSCDLGSSGGTFLRGLVVHERSECQIGLKLDITGHVIYHVMGLKV
jgi:hypothetical protein